MDSLCELLRVLPTEVLVPNVVREHVDVNDPFDRQAVVGVVLREHANNTLDELEHFSP